MMKIGLYASMFGKENPPQLESVESYIELAHELNVDVIDFLSGRGFQSKETDYLLGVKRTCLKYGFSIGYLASTGHFFGTDEDLAKKVLKAKDDARTASFMGSPLIRLFTGPPLDDPEDRAREIRCFQEICDHAAECGIVVGLQNHPSTGDDMLRILRQTDRENFTVIMDTGQWLGSPARNKGQADPDVDTYRYMEQVAPHTSHVRAKFYKIDSGVEAWLDYQRIVRILRDAGFNGHLSVVFEGKEVNTCDDRTSLRLAVAHLRDILR
ncbi:MAG: sugar phosphate isomerase/epimerase [Candidatus Latescibacteria bacterium]|nr:sugar phosphate isomerase/epimerase [Candidatus Latescibacterota bacterium]